MAESRLAETMAELLAQHQEQICVCKEEIRKTFNSKTKLEKTHMFVDRNSDLVDVAHDDLQQMCMRLEGMSTQLSQLQKQLAAHEALVLDKHLEMAEMRRCMQTQQDKYQELLYMKLTLDLEVAAYRKTLEGHEERLGLSLNHPPTCVIVTLPSNPDPLQHTGKKVSRVLDGTITRITQEASARGGLTSDLEDKCVTFNEPDQCSGVSVVDDQIWAANGGDSQNSPTDLVWRTPNSWGSEAQFHTNLINDNGEADLSTCKDRKCNMCIHKVMCSPCSH